MGCTLQRGRFRLWKSSTSGCIRSRGDAKLSFLSLPSPMVPWQCETSTKQPGQKKHFEYPRHNLVCPTTRTYSICSELYMLDLKLFVAFDMSLVTNLAFQQWPTIKFSWSKIYACWKDLHRLGLFHLCPQPPSLYQSNDWALAEVLSANCDPRSPAPNVDWEPRGSPGKIWKLKYIPTSTMMRNTIVATLCNSPAAVPSAAASSNKRLIQHSQISATGPEVLASSIVGYEWKTISHPFDSDIHPFSINHNSWTPKRTVQGQKLEHFQAWVNASRKINMELENNYTVENPKKSSESTPSLFFRFDLLIFWGEKKHRKRHNNARLRLSFSLPKMLRSQAEAEAEAEATGWQPDGLQSLRRIGG